MGIHPGINGLNGLPFMDYTEPDKIDILLISHFHLDHCGGLPWFLTKTQFKGRVFMTYATKAIYRWLLSDYIKGKGLKIIILTTLKSKFNKAFESVKCWSRRTPLHRKRS